MCTFENEKEVKMIEFDLDISDKEVKDLYEFGLREITNDTNAVVNYAVNIILERMVSELSDTNDELVEKIKKLKKTKKTKKSKKTKKDNTND